MNINWYPGHMKKTKESIERNLSMVDIVYEIIDARIPYSSRNPIIDEIIGDKPRLIIMAKEDLADDRANKTWDIYFNQRGISSLRVNNLKNISLDHIVNISNRLTREKMEKLRKKGIKHRPIRAMIIGIPNVGKSTLINNLSGRRGARVGNKPGVTRANQWIKIKGNLELLDTPGILWPKFEDKDIALNLAITGAIKDELLDLETLAMELVKKLNFISPRLLRDRYGIDSKAGSAYDIINEIGRKRGCIIQGGEVDFHQASNLLLDEFRKGRIGRISLELPEDNL